MSTEFVRNGLCTCTPDTVCANCRFCQTSNTSLGRKALCARITRFLVLELPYQRAVQKAMETLFPGKVVYDDEKDICTLLFESVLFGDAQVGTTPLSYFAEHASLSTVEKHLYQSWMAETRFGAFKIKQVARGKELQVADLASGARYRIFEDRGTATMSEGSVIVARLVPFLNGWMITSETVLSFPAPTTLQQLTQIYGTVTNQFLFTRAYHKSEKRRGTR